MPKLTSPTGVTVNVSEDKADQLRAIGYSADGIAAKKAPAKKAPAKKAVAPKTEK